MRSTLTAVALALLAALAPAHAQETWPQRQVTIVVPFGAGGTTDMFGRIFAQAMQAKYGSPFNVKTAPGRPAT
jgi:tripartite-type tricarboxylate transporter receptor subunit TctC